MHAQLLLSCSSHLAVAAASTKTSETSIAVPSDPKSLLAVPRSGVCDLSMRTPPTPPW